MLNTTTTGGGTIDNEKKGVYKAVSLFLIILSVFFALKIVHSFRAGAGATVGEISISGHGEVQAVPDIANIYFTITKEAKTAKEAQDAVARVESEALASLQANEIADKDIKTENASFNPKYEWQSEAGVKLPCSDWGCSYGKRVVVGFEASESITVKVRDIDSVGKIMQDLGVLGVSNLSGPNFSIDDEEVLTVQARKKAIDNAKTKADALAKDLGVKLGKVVTFSEGYDYPVMYGKAMLESADATISLPARLPAGENTISSDVTITYEIR